MIIREARDEDKEDILELLNTVFDNIQRSEFKRGDAFWNWKYKSNVFGEPILTVAEVDNKIVGVNNLWPWQFVSRGNIVKGLQPCDSAIHKDYQGLGLFSKMRIDGLKRAKEKGYEIIYNFPNKNSLNSYLNLGWKSLGKLPWRVSILRPFNIIYGTLFTSKSVPYQIEENYKLDIEFLDKLTKFNYDGYFNTLYLPNYFKWRFESHPTLKYGMISLKNKHKSVAAIFTIKQKGNIREMVVVEIVGYGEEIVSLFKKIKKEAKKMKVDFIAVIETEKLQTKKLWKLGFLKKTNKNFVVLPLEFNIEEKASNFSTWNMMASLHDSI